MVERNDSLQHVIRRRSGRCSILFLAVRWLHFARREVANFMPPFVAESVNELENIRDRL